MPLERYEGDFHYEFGPYEGKEMLTFRISASGRYTVRTERAASGNIAVGRSVAPMRFGVAVTGAILVAGIGVTIGTLLVAVTALRRHRAP